MAVKTVYVTDREIDILLHHHRVEEARWSNEEPDLRRQAKYAIRYWEGVKAGEYGEARPFVRFPGDATGCLG